MCVCELGDEIRYVTKANTAAEAVRVLTGEIRSSTKVSLGFIVRVTGCARRQNKIHLKDNAGTWELLLVCESKEPR